MWQKTATSSSLCWPLWSKVAWSFRLAMASRYRSRVFRVAGRRKTWQVLMSTASLCRPGSSRRAGSRKHGTSEFHGFGDVHASTSEGQPFRSAPTKPSKPTSKDMSKAMALVGSELLFVRREAFRSALLWTLRSRNCGKIRSSWTGLVTHH